MIVKLVELKNSGGKYCLQEIYINPEQVVYVRPHPEMRIDEQIYPDGLDSRQEFSKVRLMHGQNGLALTIVGPPALVEQKINEAGKQLLKG